MSVSCRLALEGSGTVILDVHGVIAVHNVVLLRIITHRWTMRTIGRSSDLQAGSCWSDLLAVASRIGLIQCLRPTTTQHRGPYDGGRSCSPLRGSPGFAPGSLFTPAASTARDRL